MNKKNLIGKSASLISSIIILAFSQQASALPGTTSNSPLFLRQYHKRIFALLRWIRHDIATTNSAGNLSYTWQQHHSSRFVLLRRNKYEIATNQLCERAASSGPLFLVAIA